MANRGTELVRTHTIVGTEAEIRAWLHSAERRGVLGPFAVAQLRDGRIALKVHVIGGQRAMRRSARWPLSTRQTIAASVALIGVALVVSVVWLIIHTVLAAAEAISRNPGPILGVLLVIALLALLGGGGGTFSGTFKGTFR